MGARCPSRLARLLAIVVAGGLIGCGDDEAGDDARLPEGTPQESGEYYQAVMRLDPDLYWRLDEPNSKTAATDVSGHGHDGYWSGGIEHGVPGAVDRNAAVEFDPSEELTVLRAYDYSPYEVDGKLTVVGITKLDQWVGQFQTLFSSDGAESNQATLEVRTEVVRWYPNVQQNYLVANYDWLRSWPGTGQWVWWALSWDDAEIDARFYVNAIMQDRSIVTNRPAPFTGDEGNFQVGNRGNGDYEVLDGVMDEVTVFERILRLAELLSLYRASGLSGA